MCSLPGMRLYIYPLVLKLIHSLLPSLSLSYTVTSKLKMYFHLFIRTLMWSMIGMPLGKPTLSLGIILHACIIKDEIFGGNSDFGKKFVSIWSSLNHLHEYLVQWYVCHSYFFRCNQLKFVKKVKKNVKNVRKQKRIFQLESGVLKFRHRSLKCNKWFCYCCEHFRFKLFENILVLLDRLLF